MTFEVWKNQADAAVMLSLALRVIAVVLAVVILITVAHMKGQSKRMVWFLAALCMVMGGLASEFTAGTDGTMNLLKGSVSTVRADIFYALSAPFFCLYFIETERDDGLEWDSRFWAVLHMLLSVFVIVLAVYGQAEFFRRGVFLFQYLLVIVMLLVSPKDLGSSLWFIFGALFPITASIAGMAWKGIRLTGFALVMMLLMLLFGYQSMIERELLEKRVLLSESRASLLTEQVKPHFIYNSLQEISSLCAEDPEEARRAIQVFSKYLRSNFEALTDAGLIPFEKEMEHVDVFLSAAGLSISRSFTVEKEISVTDFVLPALSVQPLVENAVQYGIGMSAAGGRVLIRTEREGGYILIRVIDDGHGKQTTLNTREKHKSIGMKNVRERLQLLCGGTLELNKSEQGTEALIRIPEVKKVEKNKKI